MTITDGLVCGWTARYAAGSFQGTFGPDGTAWEVKRVEKKPPTLGKKPPEGAIALLAGKKNLPEMVRANGADWHLGDMSQQGCTVWEAPLQIVSAKEPKAWPGPDQLLPQGWALGKEHRRADVVTGIADGSLQVPKGGMNSKRSFEGSFDPARRVLFLPLMPAARQGARPTAASTCPTARRSRSWTRSARPPTPAVAAAACMPTRTPTRWT